MKSVETKMKQYREKIFVGPKKPIDVQMQVRLDGSKHPICLDCKHGVASHGERNSKVFCWGCAAANQVGKCNDGVFSEFKPPERIQ